jgi:DNA primase
VIGFTARLLTDDKNAPKYINTPQTVLYDKSRHVFGLHLAKEAIRKSNFAVIAEGNLDVIMSHQAGVKQVVATAGTALTEQQLKVLSRLTPDIRLSFDADRAGVSATERAIPIASKVGVSLSIIDIPSGKDPDELIKQDPGLWQEIISKPKYALDWLIERYEHELDLTSAVGKRQFSDILLPIVRSLSDSVEQDHYLNKIAELAGVSKEALVAKMNQKAAPAAPTRKVRKADLPKLDQASVEYHKAQDHFLSLVLMHPPLRELLNIMTPDMFARKSARELYTFLTEHPDFSGKPAELSTVMQSLADYVKILVLQYEELYRDLELLELKYEATRLLNRLVEKFVKHEKQKLIAGMGQADEAVTAELLARVKRLDALLKEAKGG